MKKYKYESITKAMCVLRSQPTASIMSDLFTKEIQKKSVEGWHVIHVAHSVNGKSIFFYALLELEEEVEVYHACI